MLLAVARLCNDEVMRDARIVAIAPWPSPYWRHLAAGRNASTPLTFVAPSLYKEQMFFVIHWSCGSCGKSPVSIFVLKFCGTRECSPDTVPSK